MEEMAGIASRTTVLQGKSRERAELALIYVKKRDEAAEAEVRAEFANYFDATA
jgi:beta-N-acetylhexosaminidase